MCGSAEKYQNTQIDPFLFVMYFINSGLSFNFRRKLDFKEYCEGPNSAKCYN